MPLFWLRRPHAPLFALLLAAIAVYPAVEPFAIGRWILNTVVFGGVSVSLVRVRAPRPAFRFAFFCGLTALAGQALHLFAGAAGAGLVSAFAQTAFYTTAAVLLVSYMLRDTRATIDELFAAGVAFLLLALAWSCAYWVLEAIAPGSFALAHPTRPGDPSWFELYYLSATTLSTTGFGDVLPVTSAARAAVILEELAGVLYVALVISRLAGFAGRSTR
jgi:hypothetical protein